MHEVDGQAFMPKQTFNSFEAFFDSFRFASMHITANAGYQLGSRLNVNGTSDRIALDLTQKARSPDWNFLFSAADG
jgi:hypothetical protein